MEKNFKNILYCVLCVALISCEANASSQKVAIIDVQKVVHESMVVADINSQISAENARLQENLEKSALKFEDDKNKLSDQQAALSEEAFQEKSADLQKNFYGEREKMSSKFMILEQSYKNALDQVANIAIKVIEDTAKSKEIDLLLNKFAVLYSKDAADLSDDVLIELNKKINKFAVDLQDMKENNSAISGE